MSVKPAADDGYVVPEAFVQVLWDHARRESPFHPIDMRPMGRWEGISLQIWSHVWAWRERIGFAIAGYTPPEDDYPMSADTIRLIFTYVIAVLVLLGSFTLLIIPSQVGAEGVIPFVTGIVGIVLGFVFNRESTTSGQRASERAMKQGAEAANTTPTITNGGA